MACHSPLCVVPAYSETVWSSGRCTVTPLRITHYESLFSVACLWYNISHTAL